MNRMLAAFCVLAASVIAASGLVTHARAEPVHAIAMHGEPALPADFSHLPYVNPDAPKGGRIAYGVVGSFDSVRPFIVRSMRTSARGVVDPEYGNLIYETLMQRSRMNPSRSMACSPNRWNGTINAASSSTISIRSRAGLTASR